VAASAGIESRLRQVEFVRARFLLEMTEAFRWTLDRALDLRSGLVRAAGRAGEEAGEIDLFESLFEALPSIDPEARRRYQKPAPPFAVHLPGAWPLVLRAGENLPLEVIFWGDGVRFIDDFETILEFLGNIGLDRRKGRFKLSGWEAADSSGQFLLVRREKRGRPGEVPLVPALWWIENSLPLPERILLTFRTPLRLISGGRPVFHCDFVQLFPFLLRRVTSMCHAYCQTDLVDDPGPLLEAAKLCGTSRNEMRWADVRAIQGKEGGHPLGGLLGELEIDLGDRADLFYLLQLGSLLNLGKGAAFGAGSYQIRRVG